MVDGHEFQELEKLIKNTFSNLACLAASFTRRHPKALFVQSGVGLDLPQVREAFHKILHCSSQSTITTLGNATKDGVELLKHVQIPSVEIVRTIATLWESPFLLTCGPSNVKMMEIFFSRLRAEPFRNVVLQHLAHYPSQFFLSVVRSTVSYLNFSIAQALHTQTVLAVEILQDLYEINQKHNIIAKRFFHIDPDVALKRDLRRDYEDWLSKNKNLFSLLNYPFLLSTITKIQLWKTETFNEMKTMMQNNALSIGENVVYPVLQLNVDRNSVLLSVMQQLAQIPHKIIFKLPLKVKFIGEEGEDVGGLSKELFNLLSSEIFNPNYGIFVTNPDTNLSWFNPAQTQEREIYQLCGIIFGLAIFNGHLLNIRLPIAFYKILMGQTPDFNDLYSINPWVHNSLQKLRQFDGDIEDLDLTFSVMEKQLGETKHINLIENGSEISVTNQNVTHYIQLMTHYYLQESIKPQFAAFREGFMSVANSPILTLFTPEELRYVQEGEDQIDFQKLQETAEYEGYTAQSRVIKDFWDIVHKFDTREKQMLMQFVTGALRVPVTGLKVKIIRTAQQEALPSSSTCFNTLVLPDYQSRQVLKEKLLKAITEGVGFFLH